MFSLSDVASCSSILAIGAHAVVVGDDEFVGEDAVDERRVVPMEGGVPVALQLNQDLLSRI